MRKATHLVIGAILLAVVAICPGGLSFAQGSTPHSVTLSWTASVTIGVTYIAYRGTVSGGPYTKIGTASGDTFVDATGTGGTKYFYVVTATDGKSESAFSNEVAATFLANPAPPTNLTGAAN